MIKSFTSLLLFALIVLLLTATNAGATRDHVHIVSKEASIDLRTDKVAVLRGGVDSSTEFVFKRGMVEHYGKPGPRVILINSRGGIVSNGNAMLKEIRLEQSKGVKVICVVEKIAHSMAFNILTNCDVRLAVPKAVMLVHKVALMNAPTYRFTAKNLRDTAEELDRDDEPFRQANAKAMGLSLEDYDLFADNETIWRAETLLQRGYLHGLAQINP
jgi:ATP-dependent protease ClpP protease subunit